MTTASAPQEPVTSNHPRVQEFKRLLQELYEADYMRFGHVGAPRIELEEGSKNIRVMTVGTQRSAYCFIEKANGNLLKTASWKAPAKGARGNIFNENCDVGTKATVHGGGLYR